MSALEDHWEERVAALDGVREELIALLGFTPRPPYGAVWGACPRCKSDACCCIDSELISCDVCRLSLAIEDALDLYDPTTILDGDGDQASLRERLAEHLTATGQGYVPTAAELLSLPPWTGPRCKVVAKPLPVRLTDEGAVIRLEDLDRTREGWAGLVREGCVSQEEADERIADSGANQWVLEVETDGVTEDDVGRLRITCDPDEEATSIEVPIEIGGRLARAIREVSSIRVSKVAISLPGGLTVARDGSGAVTITCDSTAVIVLPAEAVRKVIQAIQQLVRQVGPIL